jgi:hypothetical protein
VDPTRASCGAGRGRPPRRALRRRVREPRPRARAGERPDGPPPLAASACARSGPRAACSPCVRRARGEGSRTHDRGKALATRGSCRPCDDASRRDPDGVTSSARERQDPWSLRRRWLPTRASGRGHVRPHVASTPLGSGPETRRPRDASKGSPARSRRRSSVRPQRSRQQAAPTRASGRKAPGPPCQASGRERGRPTEGLAPARGWEPVREREQEAEAARVPEEGSSHAAAGVPADRRRCRRRRPGSRDGRRRRRARAPRTNRPRRSTRPPPPRPRGARGAARGA